jgi:hypothetical protein
VEATPEKLLELVDTPDNTIVPTGAGIEALKGGEPKKVSEVPCRAEEAISRQPEPPSEGIAGEAMTENKQDLPGVVREFAGHYVLERHAELQEFDSNFQARIDVKGPEAVELIKQYCVDRSDHHGEALMFTSGSSDATSINPAYGQHLETAEAKTG